MRHLRTILIGSEEVRYGSKVGKMIVCDRCGNSVFLECIGEGENDGGYTNCITDITEANIFF